MTTRLWDVRDALAAMFTTALATAGPAAGPVPVLPGTRARNATPKHFVLVGADGGDTGIGDGITDDGLVATQEPSSMGNGWRDETGTVVCSAWAWSGNSTNETTETAIRAYTDLCAAALHADRTLGGLLKLPGLAELSSVRVRESFPTSGPVVRAVFHVSYGALITT